MKFAVVSHHTPNYQEMANITVPSKEQYAAKHGYSLFIKTDNFLNKPGLYPSYEKCFYLTTIMNANPDIEWFWYSGCDCLITNLDITLESLIDSNFHFIVTKDDHGIGGDVFFIRNTPEGREYMQHLEEPHWCGTEQGHMWDDESNPKWLALTKYIPQYYMNSYEMKYYPHKRGFDLFNQRSQWLTGDFLIQAITGLMPAEMTTKDVYNWKVNILKENVVYSTSTLITNG